MRDDDDDAGPEDDFESEGDGEAQAEAEVICPYCGEPNLISLDSGGGADQEYVEDCHVCCRPWQVRVHYDDAGVADVWLSESE